MHCHSVDGGSSKVARRAQNAITIASRFKSCDIVWVKMLSSPWWPGTLFDRTWMSDEDQSKKKAGTVCIRFFGTYEVCHLVPDPGNLHPYSDFPDFDAPPFESWRRGDKIQEKRQQEAEKYKRALLEASLLFKEACNGDKNIVPIFWGVTREQDLCQICGSVEDPLGSLLLCDQCDTPWHMECLRPPLIRVPDGDWFCPDCAGRVTRRTAVLDELYSMRDDMCSAKRGRGSREVLPVADDAPQDVVGSIRPLLFSCSPLMDDRGKRLRRAASAAKPPAPLQVALARCPPKQTKRACAGPSAVTLPGEGSGGDGVKAQAGQGRAGGVAKRKRCEHGRERSKCKDCGGSSICEHGRERSRCKDCGGSGICEHGRRRSQCKDCGGSCICEHGRQRSRCKDCGGGGICQHGRLRSECKECRSIAQTSGHSRKAMAGSEIRGAFSQVIVAAAPAGGRGKSKSAYQICSHVRNA